MSNVNEDFDYLCKQFKAGIVFGAGITLFTSGILIGFKTASFIVDIANSISKDGILMCKEALRAILEEEDDDT